MTAGFTALGLDVPDFATLSRKDALDQVVRFESALAGASNPSQAASDLLPFLTEGLRDLNSAYIPTVWV